MFTPLTKSRTLWLSTNLIALKSRVIAVESLSGTSWKRAVPLPDLPESDEHDGPPAPPAAVSPPPGLDPIEVHHLNYFESLCFRRGQALQDSLERRIFLPDPD